MSSSKRVFELEHLLDLCLAENFEYVPRKLYGTTRSLKNPIPLINGAFGALLPAFSPFRNLPRTEDPYLMESREYYKIDLCDFLDYATNELTDIASIKLQDFPDNTAIFFESLNTESTPVVHGSVGVMGKSIPISIRDGVLARDGVLLSITLRFHNLLMGDGDVAFPTHKHPSLATMSFMPDTPPMTPLKEASSWPPSEVERVAFLPPEKGDQEWRYYWSGELTNSAIEQVLERDSSDSTREFVGKVREQGKRNITTDAAYFELCKLMLLLPRYLEFMYDLIVSEQQRVGTEKAKQMVPGKQGQMVLKQATHPIYRTIKSIRVIRNVDEDPNVAVSERVWTPPKYTVSVRGHWRHYEGQTTKGHDPFGEPVVGKTWVRSHSRYADNDHSEEVISNADSTRKCNGQEASRSIEYFVRRAVVE